MEAGYSTGAVYSNFKGKEDLFLTLIEERIDPRLGNVYEAKRPSSRPASRRSKHPAASCSVLRGERDAFVLLIDFWGQAIRDPTSMIDVEFGHGEPIGSPSGPAMNMKL